jgi:hypothetical protein
MSHFPLVTAETLDSVQSEPLAPESSVCLQSVSPKQEQNRNLVKTWTSGGVGEANILSFDALSDGS